MDSGEGRRRPRRKQTDVERYNRKSAQIMRSLREKTGLYQAEFGKLIHNTSQSTVSHWEFGDHTPDYDVHEKIIEVGRQYGMAISKDDLIE